MMYDEDDDQPNYSSWEGCGGYLLYGWTEEPPADAQPGESPLRYTIRTKPDELENCDQ